MGGRIWVESEAGQGSQFHFLIDLPVGTPDDIPASPVDAARLTGLRILIVDDNETNRRILETMCRNWQMIPTAVGSAEAGLDLLRKAARQGPAFDVVITDASMPEVDGFTFADHIHQDPQIRSTLVMMLTSLDRMGDATRCEELGIKSYLVKPVKQSDLFDAIVLALEGERRGPAVSPIAPETLPRLRRLNILLAEDSLANQKLAKGLLSPVGDMTSPSSITDLKPWRPSANGTSTSSSWTSRCPNWMETRPPGRSRTRSRNSPASADHRDDGACDEG